MAIKKGVNNPPVGLATAETGRLNGKIKCQFDPHLDPQLQWTEKKEDASFDVDTPEMRKNISFNLKIN